jgi:hypothetical protein
MNPLTLHLTKLAPLGLTVARGLWCNYRATFLGLFCLITLGLAAQESTPDICNFEVTKPTNLSVPMGLK